MTLKELRLPALILTSLVLVAAARASVTETFKQTYPLNADGTVHLENVNGDIDIVASVDVVASGGIAEATNLDQIRVLVIHDQQCG